MRVVLDTNTLVSAFVFPGGVPEAVFRMAVEEQIDVISSRSLLAEFGRVLRGKFDGNPRVSPKQLLRLPNRQ